MSRNRLYLYLNKDWFYFTLFLLLVIEDKAELLKTFPNVLGTAGPHTFYKTHLYNNVFFCQALSKETIGF